MDPEVTCTVSDLESNQGNNSVFFSIGDKSAYQFIHLKNQAYDEKKVDEYSSNSCSVSSEIEKNLDFLTEINSERDELNKAKLEANRKSKPEIKEVKNNNPESNRSSASEQSEKYDKIEEFSFDKVDKPERYAKRLSTDASSILMTQYSSNGRFEKLVKEKLNNLNNANNYDYDVNKSLNSLNWSVGSKSYTSPNMSFSPTKNRSPINTGGYNQMLCPEGKIFPSNQINSNNMNNMFLSPNKATPFTLNANLNAYSPNTINPLHFNSKNNSVDHSFNNINQNNMFDKNMSKMINNAFSINLIGNNYNSLNMNNSFSNMNNNSFNNMNNSFNNMSYNNSVYVYEDNYLLENLLILLKDQNGCRTVQKKLEERANDYDFLNQFFDKIQNNLVDVINDQFGNYVIQKFFENIQNDNIMIVKLFERIRSFIYLISVNPYGTRFFQRALEILIKNYQSVETNVINNILRELVEQHMLDLILDTNGNHVFQKIVILYPKNKNQFIFDELSKICLNVAKLKQGGCIFQRVFDHANPNQRKALVLDILTNYLEVLINDEYGNFIIQQIVFLKNVEFNDIIAKFLKDNILILAKKKFSSNVIDKVKLYYLFD